MASYNLWTRKVVGSAHQTFSWNIASQVGNTYKVTSVVIYIEGAASGSPINLYHDDTPIADIKNHTSYTVPGAGNSGSYYVRSASTGSFYITVTVYYKAAYTASTFTATDVYIGDASATNNITTIDIKNSLSMSGLTHKITWSMTGSDGQTHSMEAWTKTGEAQISYQFQEDEWFPYMPTNATVGTCTVRVQTWQGSTAIGTTSKTINITIPAEDKYIPSIEGGAFTQSQGSNWLNGHPWKTRSTVQLSWELGKCSAKNGGSLVSWTLTGPGFTNNQKTGTWENETTHIETTSVLQVAGNQTWTLTIADSRGLTRSATVDVYVADYSLPVITETYCGRTKGDDKIPDSSGERPLGSFSYSIYNTEDGNTVSSAQIQVLLNGRYKAINEGIAESGQTYASSDPLELGNRYQVRFVVKDALGGEATAEGLIDTAYVFMRWDKTYNAFGFGAYPLKDNGKNQLYINPEWKMYVHGMEILDLIYPVGSIYMSMKNTNPSAFFGGTWEPIEGKFLLSCDTNHPAGDEGGSATHGHTVEGHALTVNELPQHYHGFLDWWQTSYGEDQGTRAAVAYNGDGDGGKQVTNNRSRTNGVIESESNMTVRSGTSIGQAHDHNLSTGDSMPPYLAVYMWQRTE